jgi:UDP-N-acetylmuramoyl-tripeptide--D-alanyl-D-alanine ligase
LLDDSYNANPASLQAALDVLSNEPGRKWLVFGDMAELGDEGERYHRAAALAASRAGVERMFTIGALAQAAAREFGRGAEHFSDSDALTATLTRALAQSNGVDITVLIKGSRVMALDRVADTLADAEPRQC